MQRVPHAPQLATSVCEFTQRAPQRDCPAVQGATHMPWMQSRSAVQRLPQRPQFSLSLRMSAHTGPHCTLGGAQPATSVPTSGRQKPPAHAYPSPHVTPHAPQLFGSTDVFTHTPAQLVCTSAQRGAHAPPAHS